MCRAPGCLFEHRLAWLGAEADPFLVGTWAFGGASLVGSCRRVDWLADGRQLTRGRPGDDCESDTWIAHSSNFLLILSGQENDPITAALKPDKIMKLDSYDRRILEESTGVREYGSTGVREYGSTGAGPTYFRTDVLPY